MKQKTNITSLPTRDTKIEKSLVSSLSPREIVSELDRYVIGQTAAKVLMDSKLSAEEIAKKSIQVASEICVFTNKNITIEKI